MGILLLVLFLILYNTFSWGYVASVFYKWFVLLWFPDLPQFGYLQFIGFILFISVIMPKHTEEIKDEYVNHEKTVLNYVIKPWLTLFVGWIIKLFFF